MKPLLFQWQHWADMLTTLSTSTLKIILSGYNTVFSPAIPQDFWVSYRQADETRLFTSVPPPTKSCIRKSILDQLCLTHHRWVSSAVVSLPVQDDKENKMNKECMTTTNTMTVTADTYLQFRDWAVMKEHVPLGGHCPHRVGRRPSSQASELVTGWKVQLTDSYYTFTSAKPDKTDTNNSSLEG